jgi:hypothetical protein
MKFKEGPRKFEMRTETADFAERVRVNQRKLTADLKPHYERWCILSVAEHSPSELSTRA